MEENQTQIALLKEINEKLALLIGISAIQGKDRNEQIGILVSQGFSNSKISEIMAIPKGTVDGIRAKKKRIK